MGTARLPPTAGPQRLSRASSEIVAPVLGWYRTHARDLPWRGDTAGPWGVLVSEIMLQQTPVARVEPAWRDWMARWPTPAALAAATRADAVRAWGTLGYPRRAVRLHDAAMLIVREYGGHVPAERTDLLRLPGVGSYTAAAVASFAFGGRHAVLDTNVRRVIARALAGTEHPAPGGPSVAERALAEALLPRRAERAARWAVAVMELGALVCTSRAPRCGSCPIADACAWRAAGMPTYSDRPRRSQAYEGTDRQARGRILGSVRAAASPVAVDALAAAWPEADQRARALRGLAADGLVEIVDGQVRLPGDGRSRSALPSLPGTADPAGPDVLDSPPRPAQDQHTQP